MKAIRGEIAIRVEGLSKRYWIGKLQRYKTLRDTLAEATGRSWRAAMSLFNGSGAHQGDGASPETLWALRDISFEVKHGEVVGVIGRNGVGKSTLLKILSRITEPTSGYTDIHGRVGALLEIGTGFHPELTGRENVYLNGAILGMKKREIDQKFNEIVAFAEVERFIDTSVKRYSTGMYLRLAFSVAAHLEPEILLVDEVLAVGDAAFQDRCLGKMGDVAKAGRTVLFVSHNMRAIGQICSRTIWLDGGRMRMQGPSREVIASYLRGDVAAQGEKRWDAEKAPGDGRVRLDAVRIAGLDGLASSTIPRDHAFTIELEYTTADSLERLWMGVHILTFDGITAVSALHPHRSAAGDPQPGGRYVSRCTIPANFLNCGHYSLRVAFGFPHGEFPVVEDRVIHFQIFADSSIYGYGDEVPGLVYPPLPWEIRKVEEPSHAGVRA